MSLRIVQPIEQSWTIEEIVERRTPQGWERAFKELKIEEDPTSPMVVSQEIKDISQVLAEDEKKYGMWFPLKKNLFRALDITPLSEVRVVIIGQDPYHQMSRITGEPVAQGLPRRPAARPWPGRRHPRHIRAAARLSDSSAGSGSNRECFGIGSEQQSD